MRELRGVIGTFLLIILILGCSNKGSNPVIPDNSETVVWMGKTYHTVKIGYQVWMRENLDAGKWILSSKNQTNNGIIEKYYYQNDSANYAWLGGLYQWDEAMQYDTIPGSRGICPPGWHIPTVTEFETLKRNVNNNGNSLKELGRGLYNGVGTNATGFSAVFAGWLDHNDFGGYDGVTMFWSSNQYYQYASFTMGLNAVSSSIDISNGGKIGGRTIRCIKDN